MLKAAFGLQSINREEQNNKRFFTSGNVIYQKLNSPTACRGVFKR